MSSVDNCFDVFGPIRLEVESLAPPVVLSRTLQHHRELGLSDEQVRRLLRVARRYHDAYVKICVHFANVGSQMDLALVKVDARRKRRLLDRHAALFRQHEDLLRRAYEEAHAILSAVQLRRVIQIHEAQRQRIIAGLIPSLRTALAPRYRITLAKK